VCEDFNPGDDRLTWRFVAVDQGVGGFEYVWLQNRFVAKAPVKRVR
jgi:hypothetical protein